MKQLIHKVNYTRNQIPYQMKPILKCWIVSLCYFRKCSYKALTIFAESSMLDVWQTISHQRCSVRKSVPINFAKFTGKHRCQSLFLINFIKKETQAQRFSCEFCKISKNTFFIEHFCWLLLDRVLNTPLNKV